MTRHLARTLAAAILLATAIGTATAQQPTQPYAPIVGQVGKDVMWVPTAQTLVDRMLDMARLTVDDYLIDLGSGDGRTVITAAKRGLKAHGIEYNPDLVGLSQRNAAAAGVEKLATFAQGDIFQSDFTQASVITLFLLPELNLQLRPQLLDMKPNTRILSNTFDMGEWTPDDQIRAATECRTYCSASLWIVPAKVAGTWQLPDGELKLAQEFQMLTGTLTSAGGSRPISNGRMRGDQIRFTVDDKIYTGRVSDNRMDGVFATETTWQATRR
ncbi:MAG: SAM-dependent methyltransferase [Xanthobacteraceae bacterium]